MSELLLSSLRGGVVRQATSVVADQTGISLKIRPDLASLASLTRRVGLTVLVEQSHDDGLTWFPFGGFIHEDVRSLLQSVDKHGVPRPWLWLRATEQVYREDIVQREGYATRRAVPTDTEALYHQLCCCPTFRVTIDTYTSDVQRRRLADAGLVYAADLETFDAPAPPVLLGRHSASLLGTFTGNEASSLAVTNSGSRTTTAGSLITVGGAHFREGSTPTAVAITDNKSNTYTDVEAVTTLCRIALGYNVAGTRGTTHTVTSTASGGTGSFPGSTLTAQEWDGIAVGPTIVTATNATSSANPLVNVTAPSGATSLAVGLLAYADASTTIAVGSGTTEAQEQDENSDFQAQAVGYKVAVASGSSAQIDWTLGASRAWCAALVVITELAAAGGDHPAVKRMGGVRFGHALGRGIW